jgi:ankyrin repeat protein
VDIYMEVPIPPGDAVCSDPECPCGDPGIVIPHGGGYVYVSQGVVEFRRDARTLVEAKQKIARLQTEAGHSIFFGPGVVAPLLMCEQGARRHNLDLEIAAADARHWWATGEVPLRPTPLASEVSSPTRGTYKAPIATTEWLELMGYATQPFGEALVRDKYLSGPGRAFYCILICPSCGGHTISAGGPSGSVTPLRAAYHSGASFLICPSCGDDWLIRYLTGRYEIGPSELLTNLPGGADLLLDRRAKALYKAAEQGDLPGVQSLLDSGALVNGIVEANLGHTTYPLEAALQYPKVAKALIDAGADVNARAPIMGTSGALFSAVVSGHPEVVRLLLKSGAIVDQRAAHTGSTPLAWAAGERKTDRSEVIRLLLEAGADANAHGFNGRAPLEAAASSGRPEHVKLLLEAGADVHWGCPLHNAAASPCPEQVIKPLLDAGAEVNARTTDEDMCPLPLAIHQAARNEVESPGATRLLIAAGSEVDMPDKDGWTPLHLAAMMGHEEIVMILLDAGADANKRTTAKKYGCESGWKPADCAKHGGSNPYQYPPHPALAKKLRAREKHRLFSFGHRDHAQDKIKL